MEDKSDKRQNLNVISLVAIVAIVAIVAMVFFNQKSAIVVPMSEEMLVELEAGQSETGAVLLGQAVTPPITLTQGQKHTLLRGTESVANFYIDNILDVPDGSGKKQIDWCVTTTANTQSGVSEQTYTLTLTPSAKLEIVENPRVGDNTRLTFTPTNVAVEEQDVQDVNKRLESTKSRGKTVKVVFRTHSGADGFCVRTKESISSVGTIKTMMILDVSSSHPFGLYSDGMNSAECATSKKSCRRRKYTADISASTAQGITISLTPKITSVKAGKSFGVDWSSTGDRTPNDWITLMQAGLPEQGAFVLQGETPDVRALTNNPINPWFYICRDTVCSSLPRSGSKTLTAPTKNPDGTDITRNTVYELRYYENDGEVLKARSIPITVLPVGTSRRGPSCIGTTPSNAHLCSGDDRELTASTPKRVVDICSEPQGSAPKCEYTCNNEYHVQGNICVANTGPPSAPTNLTASCDGILAGSGSEGIMMKLIWTLGSGTTSHKIRVNDKNGDLKAGSDITNSGCSQGDSFDWCTSIPFGSGFGTSYKPSFITVQGHEYEWTVQACNSNGCSDPVTGGPPGFSGCRFKFGGVTFSAPSPTQTGPAQQINPTTGAAITVTFTVPQGIIVGTNDVITFAPTTTNLPITHQSNHPSGTAADSNGIVTKTIAESKYGQGTVKQLPSTTARSVTINAPIVPGNYKIRYYDDAGTGQTLKTWETPSYFAGESDATIAVT